MTEVWPDELELELYGIAQGGDAVGRWQGRAVFAAGGLPGERVRVRLRDRQSAFARGEVTKVLDAAPERRASPCPLEERCGAADWRWIDYAAQLQYKQTILEEQLLHLGGLEVTVAQAHGMTMADAPGNGSQENAGPGWGYRTTAELHIANGHVGYFAPSTRRVEDVPQCCLHHPLINVALASLRGLIAAHSEPHGVTIRCAPASGEVLAVLDAARPLLKLARAWSDATPSIVGILQRNRNRWTTLIGQDHLEQRLRGLRWHVGAGSFFQVNDRQTARLIDLVLNRMEARPGQRLLDLFCGVGTFALPLAQAGATVIGIEAYTQAIDDARQSAALNGISRVEWHAGPVEVVLGRLQGSFDGAVLDPPRRGCESSALRELLRLRPRRIVYVSCHPGTLARDCKILCAGGYRIVRAEAVDLFPQTHHIESIVTLEASP